MGKDSEVAKQEAFKSLYNSILVDILDEVTMSKRDLDVKSINDVLQMISQQGIPILMTMMQIASDDTVNTLAFMAFSNAATSKLKDYLKEE